ncbi:Hypothetical protein I595_1745 [Croceitalea dokdonensis DOKDO 023]|uniref:Uncharacterized protein n=1 Tax=Croceitalea dokdonensis DOKDO 023 TaxID=1300341 RepID=A0A0P7AFL2_9FLAO|nr:Hypothetical protein I595_1745 [Croceitalea dokdonensis DOKDO 023]
METENDFKNPQLHRNMAVTAKIFIGVGSMVGPGIFIFPGIDGSYAQICVALVSSRKYPFSGDGPGYQAPKTILLPTLGIWAVSFCCFP